MKREILPDLKYGELEMMERLLKSGKTKHKVAVRLLIVTNRAMGKGTTETAGILGTSLKSISRTVKKYNAEGLRSLLQDKTRKPGTKPISEKKKNEICALVCTGKPKNKTHWSVRDIAKKTGVGKSSVSIILRERNIQPHRVKKFQYSTDKQFEEKLEDVVGLYMNPPDNAIVLCVDEKSQIQALERTQPILPMRWNMPERQTVDYERHGTTTLFAALDILTGKVIGDCRNRHTSAEYIAFLKMLDKKCSKEKTLHIVADNYSTHKTDGVQEYLKTREGRFVLHFIPTHSSWLNQIERWFAELTNKRIRRESWSSVTELTEAIRAYIIGWNKNSKPFKWTKSAADILYSIEKTKM